MKNKIIDFLNSIFVPVILLVIWQLLSNAGLLYEVILPSPVKVVKAFVDMVADGTLFIDIVVSGKRVLIGCFWGILLGLILGVASGLNCFLERIFDPILNVIRQISIYAWIPLIILWFGIGELSKDIIIAKSVLVPVYMNALSGIRDIQVSYVELSEVLELNKPTFLKKIVFPAASPIIFAGLRLSVGNAWTSVVAAEMLGGLTGLGYALLNAKDYLRSDRLIALMAVIAAIGVFLDFILRKIERRAFIWKANV